MSTFSHISPISSLSVIHKFDYVFAENGTVQYKDGKLLSKHVSPNDTFHVLFLTTLGWPTVMNLPLLHQAIHRETCCAFYSIRPFRTKSERSCCRTWSTSASATWGSSSCQKNGETQRAVRPAMAQTFGDTHTHTDTDLSPALLVCRNVNSLHLSALTCWSRSKHACCCDAFGWQIFSVVRVFLYVFVAFIGTFMYHTWTICVILPAGGLSLSSEMECSTFPPLVGTAPWRSEWNSLKSTR